MMDKSLKLHVITPVLLSFFVMSFVDLVGIGVDRVSSDLGINTALAQFIPSAAFIWFLVLSIPTGTFQAKYGKKTTLLVGQATTVVGLLLPFFRIPLSVFL